MGLDMYAFTIPDRPRRDVDFSATDPTGLYCWRKHPSLHGWMEQLYREKGGSAECFNCVNLGLDAGDLDRLEADIRAGDLPPTEGFFFGESDGTEIEDDLQFVMYAREALAANLYVFYSSWW